MFRKGSRDGFQIKIAIRNMNQQQAVILEMLAIKISAFLRDQMHGNRVTGERIDNQYVELL